MAYDFSKLHPEVQKKGQELLEKCGARGLPIRITDCVRTKAEQDALYAQGRTEPGSIVTNARYPQSNHCWGIAFDFCRDDGKGAYNTEGNYFEKVGAVGKSIGLFWGGDFDTILDRPHFEYRKFGVWADLETKYGTPERFFASWDEERPALEDQYVKSLQVSLNDDHPSLPLYPIYHN